MNAPDTSVVVAAFASWHEDHALARRSLRGDIRLIGHVAIESFAVLTRLPPPHRATPAIVLEFLAGNSPGNVLSLPGGEHRRFLQRLPVLGISYDAFIAATALHAGATLLTLDLRALSTYESVGARIRLLS